MYSKCSIATQSCLQVLSATVDKEEQLTKVQPVLQRPNTTPSPPATNNFDFPLLLEALQEPPITAKMPLQDLLEEEEIEDAFFQSDLGGEVPESPTVAADSPVLTKQVDTTQQPWLEDMYGPDEPSEPDLYSIESAIEEARSYYGDTRPGFCIATSKARTKEIQLVDSCQRAEIRFHDWDAKCGFWTYTDEINDTYIVKWKAGKYFVWEGVEQGFSKAPFANVLKSASENSQGSPSPSISSLRKRTVRQLKPYSMYRAEKTYDQKGVKLSEAKLEEVVRDHRSLQEPGARPRKRKHHNVHEVNSPPHRGSSSTKPRATKFDVPAGVSDEDVLQNTTLRTRFHAFDKATIPIAFSKCASHTVFFTTIRKKWAFQLGERNPTYCVVKFPWETEDQNLLLQESDEDGFMDMINEIREWLRWNPERKAEIIIEIYTE